MLPAKMVICKFTCRCCILNWLAKNICNIIAQFSADSTVATNAKARAANPIPLAANAMPGLATKVVLTAGMSFYLKNHLIFFTRE
ncbi:hypothetical protein LpnH3D14_03327 (plasmid) [Legionella pneumophila]|nr:hypothetical protein LpnH3D14_03327 [Legionella pneumophila]